jgi:TctA family transporter
MLPFVFDMKPLDAFAFDRMLAVTSAGIPILFGVPGESISAALILDGHQMAKNGEAGRALGAALMSSLIGALIGAFVLAASIPVVAPLVLTFKSPEFFALALLGITFVAALSGESKLKGMVAAGVGLVLSMVGLDPQSGNASLRPRNDETLGWSWLVPVTVGSLRFPRLSIFGLEVPVSPTSVLANWEGVAQGVRDTFTHWGVTVRCSLMELSWV